MQPDYICEITLTVFLSKGRQPLTFSTGCPVFEGKMIRKFVNGLWVPVPFYQGIGEKVYTYLRSWLPKSVKFEVEAKQSNLSITGSLCPCSSEYIAKDLVQLLLTHLIYEQNQNGTC